MGASIVRQDDSYSFEVISKTLDTVIPALIQVCSHLVSSVMLYEIIVHEWELVSSVIRLKERNKDNLGREVWLSSKH